MMKESRKEEAGKIEEVKETTPKTRASVLKVVNAKRRG